MAPRNVIVTGAASGIGRECARILLQQGEARIAALDIQEQALAQAYGDDDRVAAIRLDLGDPESCGAAVAEAIDYLETVDALIHFAAMWSGTGWEDSDPAEWTRMLAVNLTGTFLVAQAVARHMVAVGSGAIVLTASDSAKVGGVAGGPAYVASKGGVIALTRSLARALGPHGVRVNAINPGVVDTPMTTSWSAELKRATAERTPLGRIARPDDIADVACFLASDAARFVTGEVVEVNGGFYFD
jgi:NAD(P)-dependent dehydrogenase (short-subunit alcohol dehydrogenase family)